MTPAPADLPTTHQVDPAQLGGPAAPDSGRCASLAADVLHDLAGEGFRMTSLTIDMTSHPLGEEPVHVVARIDKRASAILFVSLAAQAGGRTAFTAQGLFSRA